MTMDDYPQFDDYPMECYNYGYTNCTGISCWNITYPANCTAMYVYVDQDVSIWQVVNLLFLIVFAVIQTTCVLVDNALSETERKNHMIPQLVILTLLFVFIVFGNTCVLVAIGLSETGRKTRMNFFIMNLAIADLSVGIFHVTIHIAETCLVTWHGGPALCKIIRYFEVFVMYASTFMIVSLSIDRVDAIARPMNFTRKAVTVKALVYAAWIASGILSAPSFLLFDTEQVNESTHCIMKLHERWQWQLYITLIALIAFIIPALIIVACYTIIIGVIWDKGRGFSNTFNSASCRSSTMFEDVEMHNVLAAEPDVRQHTDRGNKGIIPQAKIRTLKMTLIIVCVFVLSWCPYFVFNLMDVYEDPRSKSANQLAVTSLIQALAPLNSAANPLIYGAFSTRICNNLRRIPCVTVCCNWFFKCRTSRRASSIRGTNASHTDQTYIDGTSGKPKQRHASSAANGRRMFCEYETSNLLGQGQGQGGGQAGHYRNGCQKATTNASNTCIYKTNDNCCKLVTGKSKGFHSRRPSGLPLVNRRMTLQDTIILETYRVGSEGRKRSSGCSLLRQSSTTSDDVSHASQTYNTCEMSCIMNDGKGNVVVRNNENGPISEEPSNYVL